MVVPGGGGALDTRLGFRVGSLGFRFEGQALGCLVDLEGTDWVAGGGGAQGVGGGTRYHSAQA